MAVPFLACMVAAAAFYHLPPRVLPTIQSIEGGQVGMVRSNTNHSEDYGPMQINSLWLGPLAQHTGQPPADVRARLIDDACFSIAVAGAILRVYLAREGGDLMRAIGDYHSHTPALHFAYRLQVEARAATLFGP